MKIQEWKKAIASIIIIGGCTLTINTQLYADNPQLEYKFHFNYDGDSLKSVSAVCGKGNYTVTLSNKDINVTGPSCSGLMELTMVPATKSQQCTASINSILLNVSLQNRLTIENSFLNPPCPN